MTVAVFGSMALPMVVSANEPADAPATERAAKPERKPEKVRGNPLATALGITPEVLAAATKAAHPAVPAMAPELKKPARRTPPPSRLLTRRQRITSPRC